MKRLRDYSGEFNPNIKLEHLSRDTLLELLKVCSKLYMAADGFWYLAVKERFGNTEALACDLWVWERGITYEMQRVTKLMNIQGNDVAALMKALQFSPWFWNLKHRMDVRDGNYGMLTVFHCPTLAAIEKEGTGREESLCQQVEPVLFKNYASFFNPAIQINYLKVPPRVSKEEICCQWEFRLQETTC